MNSKFYYYKNQNNNLIYILNENCNFYRLLIIDVSLNLNSKFYYYKNQNNNLIYNLNENCNFYRLLIIDVSFAIYLDYFKKEVLIWLGHLTCLGILYGRSYHRDSCQPRWSHLVTPDQWVLILRLIRLKHFGNARIHFSQWSCLNSSRLEWKQHHYCFVIFFLRKSCSPGKLRHIRVSFLILIYLL